MLAFALDVWAASKTPVLHARTLVVHTPPYAAGTPIKGGLALDGSEAAFAKGAAPCGGVYRWNLATGGTSLLSGAKTCAVEEGNGGIVAIGLAGSHSAAWLYNYNGNELSGERLFSTTAKPGKDTVLATAYRRDFKGTWIGGLVSDGDGSRLTYATWSTGATGASSPTGGKGATGLRGPMGVNGPIGPTRAAGVVSASALWRISGSTTYRIAQGSGAVVSASGDAGRIALLRSDGSAAVYGTAGNFVRRIVGADFPCIPGQPGPARCAGEAIALTGNLVGVLADPNPWGQAGLIKVYDRTSGALLHTWPNITSYEETFDAYAGIAVYGTGPSLNAIDLRTGKNTVVAKRNYEIEQARFDKAGLLYYFNGSWSPQNGQNGLLVFVPFKTIAAKLGR
jgi:hypothetical protein